MLDALEVLRAASPARIEVVVGSGKGVVLDLSEPRE
jgi:hypothetical protein